MYFWQCLNHLEVEYDITANDADRGSLSSSVTVTSKAVPSMSVTMSGYRGDGTIDANADTTDKLVYSVSADVWETVVTLNYTVGGVSKTKTASIVAQPEFMGMLWLFSTGEKHGGTAGDRSVNIGLQLQYPAGDRHSYALQFTGVRLGWMKAVTQGSGVTTFEPVGDTRTVWSGADPSPFTGPEGPTPDGDNMLLLYRYIDTVDVTPSTAAEEAGATHYYFLFDLTGTGTDTDATVYTVHNPVEVQSFPEALPVDSFTPPTVSLSHLWYWASVNHIEVAYEVTPNDADTDSICSTATVSSVNLPDLSITLPTQDGSGAIAANADTREFLYYFSTDSWKTDIELDYTVNGDSRSTTVSFDPQLPYFWSFWESYELYASEPDLNLEVDFSYELSDRQSYEIEFYQVELGWAMEESSGNQSYMVRIGGTQQLWDGSDPSPFYGPYPYTSGDRSHIGFSYWQQNVDLDLPVNDQQPYKATHFYLIFYANVVAEDTDNSRYYSEPQQFTLYTPYYPLG